MALAQSHGVHLLFHAFVLASFLPDARSRRKLLPSVDSGMPTLSAMAGSPRG